MALRPNDQLPLPPNAPDQPSGNSALNALPVDQRGNDPLSPTTLIYNYLRQQGMPLTSENVSRALSANSRQPGIIPSPDANMPGAPMPIPMINDVPGANTGGGSSKRSAPPAARWDVPSDQARWDLPTSILKGASPQPYIPLPNAGAPAIGEPAPPMTLPPPAPPANVGAAPLPTIPPPPAAAAAQVPSPIPPEAMAKAVPPELPAPPALPQLPAPRPQLALPAPEVPQAPRIAAPPEVPRISAPSPQLALPAPGKQFRGAPIEMPNIGPRAGPALTGAGIGGRVAGPVGAAVGGGLGALAPEGRALTDYIMKNLHLR